MSPRELIVNNLSWKVVSVLAATLIWLTIHSSIQGTIRTPVHAISPEGTVTLNLPIVVATAAADPQMFRISPYTVDVTLGGDPDQLARIKASDLDAFVNLIDVIDSHHLRKKVQVRVPPGLNLIRVEPADVSVETVSATGNPVRPTPKQP